MMDFRFYFTVDDIFPGFGSVFYDEAKRRRKSPGEKKVIQHHIERSGGFSKYENEISDHDEVRSYGKF